MQGGHWVNVVFETFYEILNVIHIISDFGLQK